jgi:two-component system, CitB family, sensor kinase
MKEPWPEAFPRPAAMGDTAGMPSFVRIQTPRRRGTRLSIGTQVLLMQAVLVFLLTVAGSAAAVFQAQATERADARRQVLGMAQTLAASPSTVAAVTSKDPTSTLQPMTLALTREAGVDFIVVMSPDGTRFTHPNPAMIGGTFAGHTAPALAGHAFTEIYAGSLGPSVRSVVPIREGGGAIIGLVSVGITEHRLGALFGQQLPIVLGLSALALVLAVLGAYAVGRRVRRQTMGLGPVALAELYEHHDAVMHAMREGLLLLDPDGRLILANDEAVRLLDLPEQAGRQGPGSTPAELGVDGPLGAALAAGRDVADEIHLTASRVLTVNQTTARRGGRDLGTVVTLRDRTEIQALTDELASVRGFAEALRASNHEAANRLHTVVTLIELDRPRDAVRFATTELATHQELVDRIMTAVEEPVLAALLLGKVTQARERGIELVVEDSTAVRALPLAVTDAVTLVGNLIDNALEAVEEVRQVWVQVRSDAEGCDGGSGLTVRVSDTGPGVPEDQVEAIFARGHTGKGGPGRGLGLALVDQIVRRSGGTVTVAARDGGGAVFEARIPGGERDE